ncbi:rod shape-determining protein MreD [Bordetella pseudohinzii]|uniref:Rod shape-determining protein MreD n=1 Tax=Bordetella pseudohinzii TaxID=1331258 RepID=A0A0J6BZ26_9BORD|nr:rod shape-determining protein MreD [Bordetella pseudohinzii]ANY14714.1 rod shape-determining protein MreD [Bordetella pseudohinzii]KMM26914.1 rod shape-determining protein MreD [Bordetella pseudohinzii]KXA76235.1 rod shape-determining protein MreD [Bordetella pseudohinzii]KXA78111.1 rod shape-determining protein MreD [Bordetella pseudohinzii]CUI59816.1 rod shape-determining protein MreD [Bordetella pseudohinzii]
MAPRNNAAQRAPRTLGTPSNVQPERLAHPAHGAFVWGTLLLVWLLSLLPWRQWPASPDILALVIAFWSAYEPRRVGMLTAFAFGLLLDVHDAGLLGGHALSYTLIAYGALALHRRLQRFDLWSQAMHMLPVFFVPQLLAQIIMAWLAGRWAGWDWAIGVLLTTALWPIVGWVLQLPQRRYDDGESSAS